MLRIFIIASFAFVWGCRSTPKNSGPAPFQNDPEVVEQGPSATKTNPQTGSIISGSVTSTEGVLPGVEDPGVSTGPNVVDGGISGGGGIPRRCFYAQTDLVGYVFEGHGLSISLEDDGKAIWKRDGKSEIYSYKLDEYYSCEITFTKKDDAEWKRSYWTDVDYSVLWEDGKKDILYPVVRTASPQE